MGHGQFRQLIEQAMEEKGWSQGNLAVAIGFLPSGTTLDATGVRRIIRGERPLTSWMLNRLIDVLDLDPIEAEAAAVEDYRTFLAVAAGAAQAATAEQPGPFTSRTTASAGRHLRLIPPPDLRRHPVERIPA